MRDIAAIERCTDDRYRRITACPCLSGCCDCDAAVYLSNSTAQSMRRDGDVARGLEMDSFVESFNLQSSEYFTGVKFRTKITGNWYGYERVH